MGSALSTGLPAVCWAHPGTRAGSNKIEIKVQRIKFIFLPFVIQRQEVPKNVEIQAPGLILGDAAPPMPNIDEALPARGSVAWSCGLQ